MQRAKAPLPQLFARVVRGRCCISSSSGWHREFEPALVGVGDRALVIRRRVAAVLHRSDALRASAVLATWYFLSFLFVYAFVPLLAVDVRAKSAVRITCRTTAGHSSMPASPSTEPT